MWAIGISKLFEHIHIVKSYNTHEFIGCKFTAFETNFTFAWLIAPRRQTARDTLTNNLFQKASGVFDNIFTSENDKLNLSLDYLQGDRNAAASIKNRDRLGVSLSTNINERILIDGKVGIPVESEEETTIIGDVKLEFLLNKQGTLRARVFNKENEFQYFGDELGYTQGLGVSYLVRFDSFDGLIRKIFNKKK